MDLSKLPKLSKSGTPAAGPPVPADALPPGESPPPIAGHAAPAAAWCPNCAAPLAAGSRFCNGCGVQLGRAPAGGGAGFEAWLSIGMGLFLLFMAPMGIRYWSATLTGQSFTPYDHPENVGEKVDFTRWVDNETGAVTDVRYRDTAQFWSDSALAAFAVVLILDGVVMAFARRRPLLWVALALTLLATLLNLGYLVFTFGTYGFAPLSFLAALFGGFMCYQQWQTLQSMPAAPRAATTA